MRFFANYNKAVRTAVEVLEDYDITQAPVDLQQIFDYLSNEVAVRTYHDWEMKYNKTKSEAIQFFDSNMGVCYSNPTTGQYLIYYNEEQSPEWARFTLAHELGHIFLEHHAQIGEPVLLRTRIPQSEYDEYEKEANAFARNLLSPAPLAKNLLAECKRNHTQHLQNAFQITQPAANTRGNLINRDMRDYSTDMIKSVLKIDMKYKMYCSSCETLIREKSAPYCPTCGSTRIGHSLKYKALAKTFSHDKQGFFYQCPRCGSEDNSEKSRFCKICGLPLRNMCLGNSADGRTHKRHPMPHFAMFCFLCGSETNYNMLNLDIKMEEDESMEYTDGVSFDEITLQVKICPVCKNEQFSQGADFCRICGTDLYNRCEGETDVDEYNRIYTTNQHSNPSNARFCETCGRPTIYFKKEILKPYTEYEIENIPPAIDDSEPAVTDSSSGVTDFGDIFGMAFGIPEPPPAPTEAPAPEPQQSIFDFDDEELPFSIN